MIRVLCQQEKLLHGYLLYHVHLLDYGIYNSCICYRVIYYNIMGIVISWVLLYDERTRVCRNGSFCCFQPLLPHHPCVRLDLRAFDGQHTIF